VSNLVEHARRELDLLGQTAEDPAYAASLVAAVAAFASYGHSGGSAMCAIAQLHELLQFKALSPLTSDPDEWIDQSGVSGSPLWQNVRDSSAFSQDGGKTWWRLDEKPRGEEPEQDTAPELVDQIRALGDTYGPLGVAIAAARLTDQSALVAKLSGQSAEPTEDTPA
jgi:hypothetical protein